MPRILSVSRKTRLKVTRDDTLAAAGFSVVSPRFPHEAPVLAAHEHVDAVVIGQVLSDHDRREIISTIRNLFPCLIVYVYSDSELPFEPLADVCINVTSGAGPLITALQQRLSPNDRSERG